MDTGFDTMDPEGMDAGNGGADMGPDGTLGDMPPEDTMGEQPQGESGGWGDASAPSGEEEGEPSGWGDVAGPIGEGGPMMPEFNQASDLKMHPPMT